ncbi:MAG: 16S rRNA (cytidine(1402)-2'-O)-methyltransferase [Candidatus Kapabacteria bacterium]|nr:16S rRNA (cytidine(1402)-2'-O)-methyltransferase [Candidatus Kapabacteria bacterium]MDW8012290.1 16S rRNA (cytidine(1402)-2'-O)-methyltransferase [Bacteroidota bacterium]
MGAESGAVGTLYVVGTPIGDIDDITLRALRVLKSCSVVFCEEFKVGARLLRAHRIDRPLETLNEHNEPEATERVLSYLRAGKDVALISDAGMPAIADPGLFLIRRVLQEGLPLVVVPGPSSITTALVRSGFSTDQFLFGGMLSRKPEERRRQLQALAEEPRTVVLLETPYRLRQLLADAAAIMPNRHAYVGCNLTMPYETHHYGTFAELFERFRTLRFRGEFVLCFEGCSVLKEPRHRL